MHSAGWCQLAILCWRGSRSNGRYSVHEYPLFHTREPGVDDMWWNENEIIQGGSFSVRMARIPRWAPANRPQHSCVGQQVTVDRATMEDRANLEVALYQ